jgi:hypothetical protein
LPSAIAMETTVRLRIPPTQYELSHACGRA